MKKKMILAALLSGIMLLSACGAHKENVSINYSATYMAENEAFAGKTLTWASKDETVATVGGGLITGVGPGSTVITATDENNSVVGEYTVTVNIVPVKNLVLSTNSTTIKAGSTMKLNYTLFPDDASDYGMSWKSADENVATVDNTGMITAVNPGQTTISVSNSDGIMQTCSVTVEQKSAYERLSSNEKELVNLALKNINAFKNPESVTIRRAQRRGTNDWIVEVSAMNGFGGINSEVYYLDNDIGFWNWQSADIDLDVTIVPGSFQIDLINEAISDMR